MPKWEVCRIDLDDSNYKKAKFVAVAETHDGEKTIAQSEEFKFSSYSKVALEERAKLVAKLLEDGWEPIHAIWMINKALVIVFKRQVSD